jgi:hypothetical protein
MERVAEHYADRHSRFCRNRIASSVMVKIFASSVLGFPQYSAFRLSTRKHTNEKPKT